MSFLLNINPNMFFALKELTQLSEKKNEMLMETLRPNVVYEMCQRRKQCYKQ